MDDEIDNRETKLGSDALVKPLVSAIASSQETRREIQNQRRTPPSVNDRVKVLKNEIAAHLEDLESKKATRRVNGERRSKAS